MAMTPYEQAALEDLIASERERTAAQIESLTRDFDAVVEWSETPPDDEHDPEGATLAFERAQTTALLERARTHLIDLEEALDRLRAGTLGRCRECGAEMTFERLMARPTARTCVACAGAARHR
jgi:RNA polymerase-binding transcription factor DksA